MRIFLFFIFLITPILSYSQQETVSSIIKKVENYYATINEYNYTSLFRLYENETSLKVIEQKQGIVLRKNGVNYQNLDNVETLNFKDFNLVINNVDKTLQISKNEMDISVLNLNYYLKSFPNKKIIKDDSFWICELKVEKGTVSQYEKVRLYINKSNFRIHKQVLFFSINQEIKRNKDKVNLNTPRLEIVLKKAKFSLKQVLELVKQENYFTIKNNKINLSNRLKKYKLITL
jgi:hypothetical protein